MFVQKAGIVFLKILFVTIFLIAHQYLSAWYLPEYCNWDYYVFSNVLLYALIIPFYQWVFRRSRAKWLDGALFSFIVSVIVTAAAWATKTDGIEVLYPDVFPFFALLAIAVIIASFSDWKSRRVIIGILVVTAFLTDRYIVAGIRHRMYMEDSKITETKSIQHISFTDLANNDIEYKPGDYKVTLMTTGFLGCVPCRQIQGLIQVFSEEYGNDKKVLIVKVNPEDSLDMILKYSGDKKDQPHFPLWIPQDRAAFNDLLSVNTHPTTVIIDAYGRIIYRFCGYTPSMKEYLRKDISEVINKELND